MPRPLYPYEIWQAVTSPPTLEYVPVVGHGAVFWNQHYSFIERFWDGYGERYAAAHDGHELAPGDKRMLVISVRIEDTYEKAVETATPGHDEFWKFLGPYGWSRGYMGPDGKPRQARTDPDADESIEHKTILLGTPGTSPRASRSTATCSASSTSRSSRISSATRTRRPTSRWPASSKRSSRCSDPPSLT